MVLSVKCKSMQTLSFYNLTVFYRHKYHPARTQVTFKNYFMCLCAFVRARVRARVCVCVQDFGNPRDLSNAHVVFIPCHTLVSGYYVIPFGVCPSVRPSVRPCSPFPIDNLSIYSRIFFKFCIHIVIGNEWYGIVNGQNPSIFNGVSALFRIGKMVFGLSFLYFSRYLNETSQICCTSKVTYCD